MPPSQNQPQRRQLPTKPAQRPKPEETEEEDQELEEEDQDQDSSSDALFEDQDADEETYEDDDDDDFSAVMDISEAEEPVFEVMPPGTYDALIEDIEAGRSSKGNKMLTWRVTVQDQKGKDRTLYFYTMLTPDGIGRTKKTIRRVAPDYDLTQFVPANIGEELSGMACRVVLRIRPYQGQKRNNVTDLLAPSPEQFSDND